MRTKTLLLTAAMGAAISGMAADPVYSVNVVGFANVDLKTGWNMVANPLQGTNNLINTVVMLDENDADLIGAQIYLFDAATQLYKDAATWFGAGAWWDINYDFPPGNGAFLYVPKDTRLTFVGEVMQGNLSNPLSFNYQIKGSQVPQAGALATALAFPSRTSDLVYIFNPVTQLYLDAFTCIEGSSNTWDPAEPTIAIAQGFFLFRDSLEPSPSLNWDRTFQVQ